MQRLIDAAASPAVSASGDRTSASAASPAHAAPSAASAAFATSPHAAAPRARAFFASTVEERTACVCFLCVVLSLSSSLARAAAFPR